MPARGQVTVRMEASGLCHTDIHAANGDWPVKPVPPFVPGHEGVGLVHAIGEGVTGLAVGERVAVPWLGYACGTCEYFLAGAAFAARVPDGIDPFDAAPLSCAGVTTYKAVKVGNVRPADPGRPEAGPTASRPLSVRSVAETVLIAWHGYFRVILRNVAPDLGDPVESREEQSDERNPMTLPYRQERLVRRADRVLRRSDPDLASMLSIFARLAAAEGMPAREQLRPQRTGPGGCCCGRRPRSPALPCSPPAWDRGPRRHAARPPGAVGPVPPAVKLGPVPPAVKP